jgi:3-methyladenine DNA glycosylase/8-oxoguanine DNA glycosylase
VVLERVAVRRGEGFAWSDRFSGGPATVLLRQSGVGVEASAWGPGAPEALAAVPGLVGALDHGAASFAPAHPVLASLLARAPEVRIGRTGRVWSALVLLVLEQRVTGRSAAATLRTLREVYGDPAPGPFPDQALPPDPERIAQESYARLHRFNLDRRRADLLVELARRARRLQSQADRPVGEALAALATLPGLGPWTLGHLARTVWGDPDAVPVGDYHLPHHVSFVLTGRPRSDDAELLAALEPWRGHRARVLRLLARAPGPPRRTARGDDPDIRDR